MRLRTLLLALLLSSGTAHAAIHSPAGSASTSVAPGTDLSSGTATATGGSAARTLAAYFGDALSIKDFSATPTTACNGSTNDTTTLQAAADSHLHVVIPAGLVCTTSGLNLTTGSRLEGEGNYSAVQPGSSAIGTSVIKYNGVGGSNSYVVRISAAALGTDTSTDTQNVTFTNLVVDGNSLAEYGVYMVRAWTNNQLDFITVTNTLKHAFWANRCWGGAIKNWMAYYNQGAGITLGFDTFSWGASPNVDQSTLDSFFAYRSGYNSNTSSYLNVFNETTQQDKEYGIGIGNNRGLTLINAQTARNGGAGIYLSTGSNAPTNFYGGYEELNGQSSGSTAEWDIWDNSNPAGWAIGFDGMHLAQTPAIRLTGTAPSRTEMGVRFKRMPFLGTINADWDNYNIEDSDRNVVFSATAPASVTTIVGGLSASSLQAAIAIISGTESASFATNVGQRISVPAGTSNNTVGAGTLAIGAATYLGIPTFTSDNAVTYTVGGTLVINGAPVAGSGITLTAARALHIVAGGASITGQTSLQGGTLQFNVNSNNATNICTGSCNGATSIGGNSGTVAINSSDWDIDATGNMIGIGAITMDGIFTQSSGSVNKVRTVTAAGAVTVATTDYHVCINKTVGAATAANLPATPTTGTEFTIDDCKGDANTNNITVTPAAGNINGAGTFVINTAYGSATMYYNGAAWVVTASR